jgi:hypothetical protein
MHIIHTDTLYWINDARVYRECVTIDDKILCVHFVGD